MSPQDPLEIQEIADTVARYLEVKDLARCVCVSKGWHDTFLPHRWRVIRSGYTYMGLLGRYAQFGPHRDSVHKHRHLIQDLSFIHDINGLDKFDYPNVRRLEFDAICSSLGPVHDPIMDLTTLTPSLVDLRLEDEDTQQPAFWEMLSEHPHLRTLTLEKMQIKSHAIPGFWKTCMNLESLRLDYVDIEDAGCSGNRIFDRLRSLSIANANTMIEPYYMNMVLQSPRLKSLAWDVGTLARVKQQSMNRHWPHLSRLFISCNVSEVEDEEDLTYMLEAIGNGLGGLVEFESNHPMEAQSPKALSLHFSTLVKVDLGSRSESAITLDILYSCPRLEVLRVGGVDVQKMAERGPWVCQQLRVLEIRFEIPDSRQDLRLLLFELLSTLTRLESLAMSFADTDFGGTHGLRLRLDDGLDLLTNLQQLRLLDFGPSYMKACPQIGVDDATWMVKNWKRLKGVYGRLNSDEAVGAQLKEILKSHGIDTFRPFLISHTTTSIQTSHVSPKPTGDTGDRRHGGTLSRGQRLCKMRLRFQDLAGYIPSSSMADHSDLSLIHKLNELDKYDYPNVRCLKLDAIFNALGSAHASIMDLTTLTPSLVDLQLTGEYRQRPAFWDMLSEHPHLKTLTLSNMLIDTHVTPGFWKTCMKLESLRLNYVNIEDAGCSRDKIFDRMRSLSIAIPSANTMIEPHYMDMILQSPRLESLEWDSVTLATVKQQSLNRHWPHLRKLFISCDIYEAEDEVDLSYVLEAIGNGCGGLVEFESNHPMETQSNKALSFHFSTLVRVDLGYRIGSTIALDLLCSCPKLEVLRVGGIDVQKMAERGPWVCQQLRALKIWFEIPDSRQDLRLLLFERLSTLTRLESLAISFTDADFGSTLGLRLRLDDGLGLLANLQQLRLLDFGSCYMKACSP
ncbi:MAG: hypothetical protein J3Q66DRAFT_438659 [Benniella sp.]|nr:MAG: hypothetical protein J3Q66DRAFT_438659 [Benniella sp.]